MFHSNGLFLVHLEQIGRRAKHKKAEEKHGFIPPPGGKSQHGTEMVSGTFPSTSTHGQHLRCSCQRRWSVSASGHQPHCSQGAICPFGPRQVPPPSTVHTCRPEASPGWLIHRDRPQGHPNKWCQCRARGSGRKAPGLTPRRTGRDRSPRGSGEAWVSSTPHSPAPSRAQLVGPRAICPHRGCGPASSRTSASASFAHGDRRSRRGVSSDCPEETGRGAGRTRLAPCRLPTAETHGRLWDATLSCWPGRKRWGQSARPRRSWVAGVTYGSAREGFTTQPRALLGSGPSSRWPPSCMAALPPGPGRLPWAQSFSHPFCGVRSVSLQTEQGLGAVSIVWVL